MPVQPSWFREDEVVVSAAPTCGINKDGLDSVDLEHSRRLAVDDVLNRDVQAILSGKSTSTVSYVPLKEVIGPWRAVPIHFDPRPLAEFEEAMKTRFKGWDSATLGELIDDGVLLRRDGHGSPPKEARTGTVPYIKVSDLRAGSVNINPTNMVPVALAEQLWRGSDSGLRAWDLLSPGRASSNIGQFCVLMPGQEQIVLTREVLVMRVLDDSAFDQFYLLWALTLKVVREQWRRLIFMQTNRDDVGDRYREVVIPIPSTRKLADVESEQFRRYFTQAAKLRADLAESLASDGEHDFPLSAAD